MRWGLRTLAALLVVWAAYFSSPYVSFYRLGKAMQARDVSQLERRVNFPALRASIARQVIPAYLSATGRDGEAKLARNQAVAGLGVTVADPILAQYISPQALADFLADPRAEMGEPGLSGGASELRLTSLGDAWRLFTTARARGFRRVVFTLPLDKPADQQFRLEMRLRGFGWQLVGVELPQPILRRLVWELIKTGPTAT
jgi:hypothetical protein